MNITLKIEGLNETLRALDKLGQSGKREAKKAVRMSLEKIRSDAIKSIQRGPKTGIVYERGKGQNLSAKHQSSSPGEAPATDTGRLASSIKIEQKEISGSVGSQLNYSFWLEFGTLKMQARPFLRPALDGNEKFIIKAFESAMLKATREFNGR